jgi:hypothetical protein
MLVTKLKLTILWAYISEIALSTLIVGALFVFYDVKIIAEFIRSAASDFASYFSVIMLAGSIGFFWAFYSKSDTAFSQWLYEKNAYNVYLSAYIAAIIIYTVLSIMLLLTDKIDNVYLSSITLWCLVLGIINAYTFIKNIVDQLRLNMEFNHRHIKKP